MDNISKKIEKTKKQIFNIEQKLKQHVGNDEKSVMRAGLLAFLGLIIGTVVGLFAILGWHTEVFSNFALILDVIDNATWFEGLIVAGCAVIGACLCGFSVLIDRSESKYNARTKKLARLHEKLKELNAQLGINYTSVASAARQQADGQSSAEPEYEFVESQDQLEE